MKRVAVLGAGVLWLGGCALPLPVQIASWALDGISYVTTEKSVADHGLSIVAERDCAVLRGIVFDNGEICRDVDDRGTGTAVAANEIDREAAPNRAKVESTAGGQATRKANGTDRPSVIEPQVRMNLARIHKPVMFEDGVRLSGYPLVISVEAPDRPASEPAANPAGKDAGDAAKDVAAIAEFSTAAGTRSDQDGNGDPEYFPAEGASDEPWRATISRLAVDDAAGATQPVVGLYFVIGSFREHENALKLRRQFRALTPAVLAAKIDQGTVYRVVVGPFEQRQAKTVHQRIYRAGIADSWAIRVTPGEWTMALVDPPAASPLLADLNPEGSRWSPIGYVRKLAQWFY